MVVGFNHNVMYKGEVFHIQTEDSGVANPHIVSLVYREGTIISSRKTSYADILKMENLDQVVEELMKEQHKDMLRRLKNGEFDERAFPAARTAPNAKPAPAAEPVPKPPSAPRAAPSTPVTPHATSQGKPSSLDEVILDFLMTDDT
ncbi:MAG: hypothetical protein ED859_08055 [Desulfuromonadales bacterium]|nr:MAG: hypothetical protein ED859_08055 [Desulfuromonadales bacterium]